MRQLCRGRRDTRGKRGYAGGGQGVVLSPPPPGPFAPLGPIQAAPGALRGAAAQSAGSLRSALSWMGQRLAGALDRTRLAE